MPTQHKFRAKIENAGDGGAYVSVPFDVEKAFGQKRVKVKALIEGQPYRGSLVRMGTECHILPVLKEIRHKTGKNFGDEIEIVVDRGYPATPGGGAPRPGAGIGKQPAGVGIL